MQPGAVRDLKAMLSGMDPELGERAWCFQPLPEGAMVPETAFAIIREAEGTCAILPAEASARGAPRFARITLRVHSDLSGVGLTGAVSTALATSGIACNMIAGLRHDHLFVPFERGEDAMAVLRQVSLDARR